MSAAKAAWNEALRLGYGNFILAVLRRQNARHLFPRRLAHVRGAPQAPQVAPGDRRVARPQICHLRSAQAVAAARQRCGRIASLALDAVVSALRSPRTRP